MTFLLGVIGLTGCTSVNTAAKARGTGEKVFYRASLDKVWQAVPEVVTQVGLREVSADNEKHVLLAKRGVTGWSWGENVAVFVEGVDAEKTSVEVISKRKLVTNITAEKWDAPIFIELDKRFARAR